MKHVRLCVLLAALAICVTAVVLLRTMQTPHPPVAGNWGRSVNGLQSRIVLDKSTFAPGEPVRAHAEVRNVSGKPVRYDGRGGRFDLVYVDGADEKLPAEPNVSVQTMAPIQFRTLESSDTTEQPKPTPRKVYDFPVLKPGDTVEAGAVRVDQMPYALVAGTYRLDWGGTQVAPTETYDSAATDPGELLLDDKYEKWHDEAKKRAEKIAVGLPPAPSFHFVMADPADAAPGRVALGRLQKAMPPGWRIEGISLPAERIHGDLYGCLSAVANPVLVVGLVHRPAPGLLSENTAGIEVYAAAERVPADDTKAKGLTYLGRCPLGHAYLLGEGGGRWTHAAFDIATALGVTEDGPKRPAGPDWGRTTSRILWAVHRHAADWRSDAFLSHVSFAPQPNELARIEYQTNIVPPTKTQPAARKDPQYPYYRVWLSVRPIGPVGQLEMTETDQAIKWDGTSSIRGYTIKRLGVQIAITVLSDDTKFVSTVNSILDQEISATLQQSAPPAAQAEGVVRF